MYIIKLYTEKDWIGVTFEDRIAAMDAFDALRDGLGNPNLFYNVKTSKVQVAMLPMGAFDRLELAEVIVGDEKILDYHPKEGA